MRTAQTAILIASLMIFHSGCATTVKYDLSKRSLEPEWQEKAYTCHTAHYTVYTDDSRETAEDIARFMEKAFKLYQEVIGGDEPGLPAFVVKVYAGEEEYEKVAVREGFPASVTTGLYSPQPPASIHLAKSRDMYRDLLHEGAHQYIDRVMIFTPPGDLKIRLNEPGRRLLAFPLWLNEGMASFVESLAGEDGQPLRESRTGGERHKYLQKLIEKNKCPSLLEVISKKYGEPFSARDYAVSWGVVFFLEKTQEGKASLREYVESCKNGFLPEAESSLSAVFNMADGHGDDLYDKWASYVSSSSVLFFQRIIIGEKMTFEEWEKSWKDEISRG